MHPSYNISDKLTRSLHTPNIALRCYLQPTQWFGFKVNEHRASQGVGYDEERRRQVVGLCQGVDTTLKVTVARQHPDRNYVTLQTDA